MMAYYEISIACKDEADLASGHRRKKAGDIISVIHPATMPHGWGKMPLQNCLIVPVYADATLDEMRALCVPYLAGRVTSLDGLSESDVLAKMLAKRRYQIPLETLRDGWIPDLDLDKVINAGYIYQPLLAEPYVIAPFDGKDGKYLITSKDVDCQTSIFAKEDVVTVDMTEKVSICYDKYLESFKYSTTRVY